MKFALAWQILLVLLVALVATPATYAQRGEPFTITSLIPDKFPDALVALKEILLNEITERGEDVAEALGAEELIGTAVDYADDFISDTQTKFEAIADLFDDDGTLDSIATIVFNAFEEYKETVEGITKFCDASTSPTVRRLFHAQSPWQLAYESTAVKGSNRRYLSDEDAAAAVDVLGGAVGAGTGLDEFTTGTPTTSPSKTPTASPIITPRPTTHPTSSPTAFPTKSPQITPSPTSNPTPTPTSSPTDQETCGEFNARIAEGVADRAAVTVGLGIGVSGGLKNSKVEGTLGIGFGAEVGATVPSRGAEGYFSWSAGFSFGATAADCQKGYYCETNGNKILCPQGYYCPENTSGTPTLKCAEGYYCPTGSSTSRGKPIQVGGSGGCAYNTECACSIAGQYCPTGSTTSNGLPVGTAGTQVDDCLVGSTCTCQAGYYCINGIRETADAGYYISTTGASSLNVALKCKTGYYCPKTSTDEEGKPAEAESGIGGCGSNDSCECSDKHFCPPTSKSKTGQPAEAFTAAVNEGSNCGAGSTCSCSNGYVCAKTSTRSLGRPVVADLTAGCQAGVDCKCEKGYYCDGALDTKGRRISNGDTYECGEGYYCPETSATYKGRPAVSDGNCVAGEPCQCDSTYFCPDASTHQTGKPLKRSDPPKLCEIDAPCTCPAGYYCKDGDITICPAGFYCAGNLGDVPTTKCAAGSFCPEGSTDPTGKPLDDFTVLNVVQCSGDSPCTCDEGYWCPEGSTTNKGRPETLTTLESVSCDSNDDCECKPGYYCPAGSKTPLGATSASTSDKECQIHHWCPKTSTDPTGKPAESQTDNGYTCAKGTPCECSAGTECAAGSAVPSDCPVGFGCPKASAKVNCLPGYFCPLKSTTNKGQPLDSTVGCGLNGASGTGTCECALGSWCPAGSTTKHGAPKALETVDNVQCAQGDNCDCEKGYYCPYSSTSPYGKPADGSLGDCSTGAPCKCSAGYYCASGSGRPDGGATSSDTAKTCAAPNYCPETSTDPSGKPVEPDGTDCLAGDACECAATFFCPDGSTDKSGKPLEAVTNTFDCSKLTPCTCPAGHYCEGPSGTENTNGIPTRCDAGYYCTAGSDSKTQNDCDAGNFCPSGSTAANGVPATLNGQKNSDCDLNTQICTCDKGYWCPARSTNKKGNPATSVMDCTNNCECEPGYFCDGAAAGKTGEKTVGGAAQKCAAGFYCPSASTNDEGKPAVTETNCAIGTSCVCEATKYCPITSTTFEGKPAEKESGDNPCDVGQVCTCRAGSVCDNGKEVACPLGYYCPTGSSTATAPACNAGYFCPAGSTTAKGNPSVSTTGCGTPNSLDGYPANAGTSECKCQGGYYCPETSTTPTGRPQVALVGTVLDGSSCARLGDCECAAGSWCPPTSTSEIGKPVTGVTGCSSGSGCFIDAGHYSEGRAYASTGDSLNSPFANVCSPGYFCREGSTKETGADVLLGCTNDLCYCGAGHYCQAGSTVKSPSSAKCQVSFWCPEGSRTPQGEPVKDSPGCAVAGDCCLEDALCPCTTGRCTSTGSTSPNDARRLLLDIAALEDEQRIELEQLEAAKKAYRGQVDGKALHIQQALETKRRLAEEEANKPVPKRKLFTNVPSKLDILEKQFRIREQEQIKLKPNSNLTSKKRLMESAMEAAMKKYEAKHQRELNEERNLADDSVIPPVMPTKVMRPPKRVVSENTSPVNSVQDAMREAVTQTVPEKLKSPVEEKANNVKHQKKNQNPSKDAGNNNMDDNDELTPSEYKMVQGIHDTARNLAFTGSFGASLGVTIYFNPAGANSFAIADANPLSGFSGYDVTISRDAPILNSFSVVFNSNYYECLNNNNEREPSGLGFFKGSYVAALSFGLLDFDFTQSPATTFNEIKSAFKQFFSRTTNFQGLQIGFNIGGGFNTRYFNRQGCLPDRDKATLAQCSDIRVFRRLVGVDEELYQTPRIRGGNVAQKIVNEAALEPVVKPKSPARRRELSTAVDEYLTLAQDVLEDGPITRDFCFGDCEADVSENKSIEGSITVQATPQCDGVQFVGTVPTLSIGGLIYTALNELDADVADSVISFMGPFGGAGVSDATLILSFTGDPSLELMLVGSPLFPDLSGVIEDDLMLFVYDKVADAASGLNVGLRAKVNGVSSAEFEVFVTLDADLDYSKPVALVSNTVPALGPKVFALARVSGPFATPTLELSMGLSISVRICVDNCGLDYADPTRMDIFFTGVIEAKIIAGPSPATTIGGALILENYVPEFLGLPFVHVGNAVLATSFNPATFPVPASILVGASVCLGAQDNCLGSGSGPVIRAAAYLGLDQNVPDKNFFVAMFSELTVNSVLAVLGDTIYPELETLRTNLPDWLRVTGVKPYDITQCSSFNSTPPAEDELASSDQTIDFNCYAYVSVAPFGEVADIIPQTQAVELSLKRGITISGEVNLFNVLKFRANALIDIFAPPAFTLEIDVDMERFTFFDDFIQVGKEIVNGEAVGGASFYFLASNQQLAFQLDIQAAIALPLLKTTGSLDVQVDDDGFAFDGSLSIFGLVNSRVIVDMPWDFSSFYLEITSIAFSPLVVIDELIVSLTPDPARFRFFFSADITVLFFAKIGGDFEIERNGENLDVDFSVTGKTGIVDATVSGSASVDLVDILDTDFGEFSVTFSPGAALEAAVEFIEDVGKAIADGVGQALEAGKQLVKDIGNFINSLDTEFIEEAYGSFKDGINSLINFDFSGALTSFGNAFKTFFSPQNWENLGLSLLDALGILSEERSEPYQISEKDDYLCNFLKVTIRKEIRTNVCGPFGFDCGWDIEVSEEPSEKFQNDTCVEIAQETLRTVRGEVDRAVAIQDSRIEAEDGNQGLITLNQTGISLTGSNKPQFADISTKVPSSNGFPTRRRLEQQNKVVDFGVSFKKLTNDASSSGFESGTTNQNQQISLDFSSPSGFQSSLENSVPTLGQVISNKVYEDMDGIPEKLGSYTGLEQELAPLTLGISASLATPDPFTCLQAGTAATTVKPYIESFDARCANGDVNNIIVKPKLGVRQSSANPEHPCGSWIQTVEWTATDFCSRTSNKIYIEITVLNIEPTFDTTGFLSQVTLSTDDNILDVSGDGIEPKVFSPCFTNEIYLDYVDSPILSTAECGVWTMTRTWRTRNNYRVCQDDFQTITQTYRIEDNSAPVFTKDVPDVVRIGFFDNFDAALPAPIVTDVAGDGYFSRAGIASGGVVLTSTDSNFVRSDGTSGEGTCRTDGIVSFTRTWTAADECGNALSKTQQVYIDHPLTSPALPVTTTLMEPEYASAIGVLQRDDKCLPGKTLNLGVKTVKTSELAQATHNCQGTWDATGCRLLTETNSLQDGVEVVAIGPYFLQDQFPVDVNLTTGDGHLPDSTGTPNGDAYCDTPWEIVYNDEEPVEVECGLWQINRVWTIIPKYAECTRVPLDSPLATNQTQVLMIRDVTPPEFNTFPETGLSPFLTNYGSNDMGAPTVQDIAPNSLLESLGLNSYPITLEMEDVIVEFPTPYMQDGACSQGLAVVTRRWTTTDRCGTAQARNQTVRIQHPGGLLGNASSYQLFTPHELEIKQASIAEDIAGGEVKLWYHSETKTEDFGSRNGTCSGNLIEPSVVSGSCPNLLGWQPYPVKAGSVVYPTGYKHNGQVLQCKENGDQLQSGLTVTEVAPEDLPVQFDAAAADVMAFSRKLQAGLPDLRTGPESVLCESNSQQSIDSCVTTSNLTAFQNGDALLDESSKTLHLNGTGQVYNFFEVSLVDWFTKHFDRKQEFMTVDVPGFVFVNVIDYFKVEKKNNWHYETSHEFETRYYNSNQFDVQARNVSYSLNSLGSGYLLANLVTEINNKDSVEDALEWSGFRLEVEAEFHFHSPNSVKPPDTTSGSFIVGNPYISLEMERYTVQGGQLILAGSNLEVDNVSVECGLFAANTACPAA